MARYAGTFGLFAFIVTVLLSIARDAPTGEVVIAAAFNALWCAVVGIALSVACRRLVNDVNVPTVEQEIEEAQQEKKLLVGLRSGHESKLWREQTRKRERLEKMRAKRNEKEEPKEQPDQPIGADSEIGST